MIHDGYYYSIVDKYRERFTIRTEIPSVRETGTNGNHVPIGQAHNDGSSSNSQEIPVAMDNVFP